MTDTTPLPPTGGPPADWQAALDDLLAQAAEAGMSPGEVLTAEGDGPWQIEDDATAEWALRMLLPARQELHDLEAQLAEWTEQLDAWMAGASAEALRRAQFFTHHLTDYALRRREATGQASVKLPSGTLATRRPEAPKVVVDDEPGLALWLQENAPEDKLPALVEWRPKVFAKPLADLVTVVAAEDGSLAVVNADGEPVPGVHAEPPQTSVTKVG